MPPLSRLDDSYMFGPKNFVRDINLRGFEWQENVGMWRDLRQMFSFKCYESSLNMFEEVHVLFLQFS
jgi:hypothetical protein